jgi:hypothetical protein
LSSGTLQYLKLGKYRFVVTSVPQKSGIQVQQPSHTVGKLLWLVHRRSRSIVINVATDITKFCECAHPAISLLILLQIKLQLRGPTPVVPWIPRQLDSLVMVANISLTQLLWGTLSGSPNYCHKLYNIKAVIKFSSNIALTLRQAAMIWELLNQWISANKTCL